MFCCPHCDLTADRDAQAAKNIHDLRLATFVTLMHFIDADCTFKVLPRLEYILGTKLAGDAEVGAVSQSWR